MERELLLLEKRKHWTEETLHLLELREAGELMLWHMELPDFYYLPASMYGDFSIAQENGEVRDAWEEYLGYTRFVGVADGECFARGEKAFVDCGEAVTAEHWEQLGYPMDDTVRRLKMGECICFYDPGTHPHHMSLADHPVVEEYLHSHQLKAAGELMLFYLMLHVEEEGTDAAVIALPVRKK